MLLKLRGHRCTKNRLIVAGNIRYTSLNVNSISAQNYLLSRKSFCALEMADAFEDEADQTVSIQELLNDVDEQELEANLVLGGDEGKECTYIKGYMKRQAIFSCLTCTPDGNAGVCTACSLSCHDGHEIVELWTKRNFRCDCGNSKFGEFVCKLFANKDIENDDNSYNHNFRGLYCTCGQPYPDPDAEEQVEMIQCCFCEDWFHEEHLGLELSDEVPRDEEGVPLYEDFMCGVCSTICSFLVLYPQIIQAAEKQLDDTENKGKHVIEDASSACGSSNKLENGNSHELREEDYNLTNKNSGTCILGVNLSVDSPGLDSSKPLFLSKDWREILCRCDKCMDFYNQKCISFLFDKDDSIVEYEKMAKQKRDEHLQKQEDAELSFLDNLGHVEKMEVLNGIADMKSEIHSFLETFDSSKAVTTDDVRKVFENLAKKRKRIE